MKNDNNFLKYVKRWLISNYSSFEYKPYIVRDLKYKGRYLLKFSSIPNIEVRIEDDGTFDMWINVKYNGKEYMENPLDLLTVIERDRKGYYCSLCLKKIYYLNKKQIWKNHLKDFIIWAKKDLQKGNKFMLEIYENDKDHVYDLKIVPSDFITNEKPNTKYISLPLKN